MADVTVHISGDDEFERKVKQLGLFFNDLRTFWPLLVPVFIGWMGAQFSTEGGWGGQTWAPLSPTYCVAVGTRVLSHDLRWRPVEELVAGDRLWAPSEEPLHGEKSPWRFWQTAIVEATAVIPASTLKLSFESGREVIATPEHPWLIRGRRTRHRRSKRDGDALVWVESRDLRSGDRFPVYADVWEPDSSYEAGWLAGIFDGEGHLGARPGRGGATGLGCVNRLGISQREGAVSERIRRLLSTKHIRWSEGTRDDGVVRFDILGGNAEIARVLGTLRPVRLIDKFRGGILRAIQNDRLIDVSPAGEREIVLLQTSTRTFFAEGFAAHNSVWKGTHYPGRTILIREGNLRRAASEPRREATPRTLTLWIDDDVAGYHQDGTDRMPARPLIPDNLPQSALRDIDEAAHVYVSTLVRQLGL